MINGMYIYYDKKVKQRLKPITQKAESLKPISNKNSQKAKGLKPISKGKGCNKKVGKGLVILQ